jgi:hypothetical protein
MRHAHARGDADGVRAPVPLESVAVAVVPTSLLRARVGRAAHDLGEEAHETQADGRHAGADETDFGLDDGPETGL